MKNAIIVLLPLARFLALAATRKGPCGATYNEALSEMKQSPDTVATLSEPR